MLLARIVLEAEHYILAGFRICRRWSTGGYRPATSRIVVRPRNIRQRQISTYLHLRYEYFLLFKIVFFALLFEKEVTISI